MWKLARSWMGCGRGVRWSASVQGVPKSVGASWSVRWHQRVAKATLDGFGAVHQNLGATYVAAQPGLLEWALCAHSNHLRGAGWPGREVDEG